MFTDPSPLSPALLTLWATNHGTLRRVNKVRGGLSGWQLDEHMNALNCWRRVRHMKDLGGPKSLLLWSLWVDNWMSHMVTKNK